MQRIALMLINSLNIFFLLMFLVISAGADQPKIQKLVIGMSNFPPYFVEETESGIFWDLVKEIFTHLPQYEVTYRAMAIPRLVEELNQGRLDGAANVTVGQEVKNAYRSIPIFRYASFAITLNGLELKDVADLQNYSIVTWQGASLAYGDTFKMIAETNKGYRELSNLEACVTMVASGRADVCVLDSFLFLYYLENRRDEVSASDFTFHDIVSFAVNDASMAFLDENVRDDVNRVISEMAAEGRLDAYYQKYLGRLPVE